VGILFYALMTLLAKKFILTVQSLRGLYSLYACPIVPVNCENSKNKKLSWCWQTCATCLEVSQGH